MTHVLKIWPGSFQAVIQGRKWHEIRDNTDRNYNEGDVVILKEFIPDGTWDVRTRKSNGSFTNAATARRITYVSSGGSWGLPANVSVFSHQPMTRDGR